MIIYAAIGAFGLIVLLAMLFLGDLFGGDHDVHADAGGADHGADHGAGPSIFSARIMGAFLTAFGAGGVISRYYGLPHPAASGIGVASGVVLAGAVYQFAKILYAQQASSEVRMGALVGQTAEVTVAIPAGGGAGQITLVYGAESTTQIARSSDGKAIPVGREVTIVALRGESVVVAPAGSKAPGGRA